MKSDIKINQKVDKKVRNRRYKKLDQLMEEDEYFTEEAVKLRQPLIYHMYVGRYACRNDGVKHISSTKDVSKFLFNHMDKGEYEAGLKKAYEDHLVATGESYFKGQMDEAAETDEKGVELTLTREELEDNEDELIRCMHDRFLDGLDGEWVDYDQIDNDSDLDDNK